MHNERCQTSQHKTGTFRRCSICRPCRRWCCCCGWCGSSRGRGRKEGRREGTSPRLVVHFASALVFQFDCVPMYRLDHLIANTCIAPFIPLLTPIIVGFISSRSFGSCNGILMTDCELYYFFRRSPTTIWASVSSIKRHNTGHIASYITSLRCCQFPQFGDVLFMYLLLRCRLYVCTL